jgi:predicted DCC family thiol-disulfide oxidoreductase YuxK
MPADPAQAQDPRPLLIYDGECAFCVYWARYWQKLTGDAVRYEPYQKVARQYPEISVSEFQRAVQYVTPDRHISSGAEASFLTLSHARGKGFWLAMYRHVPGFALVCEWVYAFIAAHRAAFYRLTLLLWGRHFSPPHYQLTTWLFLRSLGLIYFTAFASLSTQILGLVGAQGILPLADYLESVSQHFDTERYWRDPMVFWLISSDSALQAACWGGVVTAILLTLNLLPRLSLVVLFVLYLSLFHAGQEFMNFKWDLLLLETGFLALLLPTGSGIAIFLMRWLLFRFIFMAGAVKLESDDASWANLTALNYHFETQPLPTPLAWYAHQLPGTVLEFATAATLFIELVLPFFIFLPRRLRFAAAWGFVPLQLCILLTGNYNFFNFLTLALCLFLFDDAALAKALPSRLGSALRQRITRTHPTKTAVVAVFATVFVLVSGTQLVATFVDRDPPTWLSALDDIVFPLHIINRYGLFAAMNVSRPVIVVEGSHDNANWREYKFKYKPGDVFRAPPWNIPHQPRLDWQIWFAALVTEDRAPWFGRFLKRLLEGSPQVLALLAEDPFPEKPPAYVRALLYDYRYATPEQKHATGVWWKRELMGLYYPAVQLKSQETVPLEPRPGMIDSILRRR